MKVVKTEEELIFDSARRISKPPNVCVIFAIKIAISRILSELGLIDNFRNRWTRIRFRVNVHPKN